MSRSYKTESRRAAREWRGPEARFDLLKEATIATIVVVVVVVAYCDYIGLGTAQIVPDLGIVRVGNDCRFPTLNSEA